MERLYTCLAVEHDPRLILLAGGIALLAMWTMLGLTERAIHGAGSLRRLWLLAAAVVAGGGVWATHFVAILAYDPGVPFVLEPWRTAVSAVAAMPVAALALGLARPGAPWRLALGGALLGAGVALMHFVGMSALRLPATISWSPALAGLAVLLGCLLGAAGLALAFAGRHCRRVLGAALLTLAVCALHFTAMAALSAEPSPFLPRPEIPPSRAALVAGVTGAVLLVSGFAALCVVFDRYLAGRAAAEGRRLRALVDATFEGVVIHDGERIIDANEPFARLVGAPREAVLDRPFGDFIEPSSPEQKGGHAAPGERREVMLRVGDGPPVPAELLSRPFDLDGRVVRVAALRDLTERRRAEERIRYLAHHDALTGLPNRALFADRLEQALALAARENREVAVLCLDLDHFKEINDGHGHPMGDAVLREIARRVEQSIRDTDTAARLSGDEFAIVQHSVAQPGGAVALAERLVAQLCATVELRGQPVDVGVSIGIAFFPHDGSNGMELLAKADAALYRAKKEGRGIFRLFEPGMDAKLRARRALERELRQAVEGAQLELHYQPQAELASGRVVGFEALLRWRHPLRGLVPPAEFIPLAEETGLIRPLGAWVLRTACAEAAGWPAPLRVAVNLSPVQFTRPGLVELVEKALLETGLAPGRLELEVTEGVLIRDTGQALEILRRLKSLGVQIAMDDFGTGYSSLSYLQRFPFDRLKVDRSFVASLEEREDSASIIRAIISLGASLGIKVVAEGVERPGQLATLRAERCGEVQGFLICQPLPASAVPAYLRAQAGSGQEGGAERPPAQPLIPALVPA